MRRKSPKLRLYRETLHCLDAGTLETVRGGTGETQDGDCTRVDSHCPIETCTCGPVIA